MVGKVWHIDVSELWTVFDNDVADGKVHYVLLYGFFQVRQKPKLKEAYISGIIQISEQTF